MNRTRLTLTTLAGFCLMTMASSLSAQPGAVDDVQDRIDALLERLDSNDDGAISKEEAGPRFWTRLSKADANKDGKVTEKEMKAAWS